MEFEFGRYVWTDIPAIDLQSDNIVGQIYVALSCEPIATRLII